jgi:hypothetical protein
MAAHIQSARAPPSHRAHDASQRDEFDRVVRPVGGGGGVACLVGKRAPAGDAARGHRSGLTPHCRLLGSSHAGGD